MAQNIYDDPAFFAGYSDFPRSRLGLEGTAEGGSLLALLPPVEGKRVVELGCGFGHLSRWLADAGAESVIGIDLSEKMLDAARAATEDRHVSYRRADLDTLELDTGSADLIVSSLTFHYVEDFSRLAAMLQRALVPGGDLVFSVEHPIYAARAVPEWAAPCGISPVWRISFRMPCRFGLRPRASGQASRDACVRCCPRRRDARTFSFSQS